MHSKTISISRSPQGNFEGSFSEKKGIEVLSNQNSTGFFIMVEGGKIDWACHANDGFTSIMEVASPQTVLTMASPSLTEHCCPFLILLFLLLT